MATSQAHLEASKRWREKNPDRVREAQRKWRERNRERQNEHKRIYANAHREQRKHSYRKSVYGIGLDEYQFMVQIQKNKCALCGCELSNGREGKGSYVDHDHKTGRVRGLLCRSCNQGMRFVDDLSWLASAIQYAGSKVFENVPLPSDPLKKIGEYTT